MEQVLSIVNLNKSFGNRAVIKNISFEVNAGEVFGFLGPNGAGKTTTIKMVTGFLFPDSGDIFICGTSLRTEYEKAMSFLGGIVENPEMYNYLNARQNLRMYAALHGNIPERRVDEVLSLVGMEQRASEKVKKYSLGMKQRVGLAMALIHKPRLLILDEPTNGLDPAGIHELRDVLKELAHKENVGILVSSHMLSEMQLMCDRVAIINEGVILGIEKTDDLVNRTYGDPVFQFIVADAASAVGALDDFYKPRVKITSDNTFEIVLGQEKIPGLVYALVSGGAQIYGVAKKTVSLESAYMDITGGGISIA